MQQQNHFICGSLSKMSVQSKRSNISDKNSQKNYGQMRDYTNLETIDIENCGSGGLLKKLSGSDNNKKKHSMMDEETYDTMDSKNYAQKLNLYKSSDQDIHTQLILPKSNISEENDLHHECTCMKLNKASYCPVFCDCYDFPEKCSEEFCCKQCYAVKQVRLSSIIESTLKGKPKQKLRDKIKHPGDSNQERKRKQRLKDEDSTNTPSFDDISEYISGSQPQNTLPVKMKCFCRNSKCEKGYCVCFKGRQQCSEDCQCEPNCNNCLPQVKALKIRQYMMPQNPILNNLRDTGSSADSHISFEKFQYRM